MMTDVIETEYNSAQRAENFARVRPADVAEGIAVVADVGTNHRTTTYNNGSCGCLGSGRRLWMVWQ